VGVNSRMAHSEKTFLHALRSELCSMRLTPPPLYPLPPGERKLSFSVSAPLTSSLQQKLRTIDGIAFRAIKPFEIGFGPLGTRIF
jgi:hypothetical protein